MFTQQGSKNKRDKEHIFNYLVSENQKQIKTGKDIAPGTLNTANINMRPDVPFDNTVPVVWQWLHLHTELCCSS